MKNIKKCHWSMIHFKKCHSEYHFWDLITFFRGKKFNSSTFQNIIGTFQWEIYIVNFRFDWHVPVSLCYNRNRTRCINKVHILGLLRGASGHFQFLVFMKSSFAKEHPDKWGAFLFPKIKSCDDLVLFFDISWKSCEIGQKITRFKITQFNLIQ